jgi:hypothetical protein
MHFERKKLKNKNQNIQSDLFTHSIGKFSCGMRVFSVTSYVNFSNSIVFCDWIQIVLNIEQSNLKRLNEIWFGWLKSKFGYLEKDNIFGANSMDTKYRHFKHYGKFIWILSNKFGDKWDHDKLSVEFSIQIQTMNSMSRPHLLVLIQKICRKNLVRSESQNMFHLLKPR